jgi:hypothetical protein
MREETKSRSYVTAMLALVLMTSMACCYQEGKVAEHARQIHDQDAMIAACRENNVILQHRYDALANESDPITVIAAEAHYQSGRE